jgi:CRISPR/Cas system-associated endonuclease Cas1
MRKTRYAPASTAGIDQSAIAETEDAIAETFASRPVAEGVAIVEGHGCHVGVDGHHLVLTDGIGKHRRSRRFGRATHGLSRVVVLARSGTVSFEASRWMAHAGVAFAQLDAFDGRILAASGTPGRNDAGLRRQQALAANAPTGLAIARYLLERKIAGQAEVGRTRLHAYTETNTLDELAARIAEAWTIDDARQIEASAANLYWSVWQRVTLRFLRRDVRRVPTTGGASKAGAPPCTRPQPAPRQTRRTP